MSTNVSLWCILAASGSSNRFNLSSSKDVPLQDKLLSPLSTGKLVIEQTVATILASDVVAGLIIVTRPECFVVYQEALKNILHNDLPVQWIPGGATRRESVWEGLCALPEGVDIVAIHDAARPFAEPTWFREAYQSLCEQPALSGLITAIPAVDTIKVADVSSNRLGIPIIQQTIPREHVWQAQTPQFFRVSSLKIAHQTVSLTVPITDDAQLIELAGLGPVGLLAGSARNQKITLPEDLI